MQGMSKDNTPIIPNPTKKVKPFCKKNCTEIFRFLCGFAGAGSCRGCGLCLDTYIKGKDTVYVSLKNKFDNHFMQNLDKK